MENKENAKKCFSYIRYSSKGKQAKGTSELRQSEIAPRVAAEKGWILDDSFSRSDLGVSGYKGDNVKTIESIIAKAKNGTIPQGTVCIIESLNRATRLDVDEAYQLIRKMLKSGIEIYTDNNQRHLSQKDLKDVGSMNRTAVELDAAYQYSAELQRRVRRSWEKKRAGDGGKLTKMGILTKVVPAWIAPLTHKIVADKANVVKKIFNLYLNGAGISAIAKKLNGEGIKPFRYAKFWDTCYIGKLLQNPIVIGELQPKIKKTLANRVPIGQPIKNYYPAIISEDIFYAAQNKYGKSFKTRTRKHKETANLFAGVATCVCGEPMNKIKGLTHSYIGCRGKAMNHGCKAPLMHYNPLEQAFLQIIGDSMELFVDKKEDYKSEIESNRGKILTLKKQIDNIKESIKDKVSITLAEELIKLENEVAELQTKLKIDGSKQTSNDDIGEQASALKNNLGNFRTDYPMRAKMRDFCLNNLASMKIDSANKTTTITANNKHKCVIEMDSEYKAFTLNGELWHLDEEFWVLAQKSDAVSKAMYKKYLAKQPPKAA